MPPADPAGGCCGCAAGGDPLARTPSGLPAPPRAAAGLQAGTQDAHGSRPGKPRLGAARPGGLCPRGWEEAGPRGQRGEGAGGGLRGTGCARTLPGAVRAGALDECALGDGALPWEGSPGGAAGGTASGETA